MATTVKYERGDGKVMYQPELSDGRRLYKLHGYKVWRYPYVTSGSTRPVTFQFRSWARMIARIAERNLMKDQFQEVN